MFPPVPYYDSFWLVMRTLLEAEIFGFAPEAPDFSRGVVHERTKTTCVIMTDKAKILDLIERDASYIEKAPEDIIFDVVDIINSFIEIEN